MKVGVSGATGFVGGALVRSLKARGHQVVASGRNPERCQGLLQAGLETVQGDLAEAAVCRQFCEGLEAVVHCAGLSSPWASSAQFQSQNVDLTRALLTQAGQSGVTHFVFLSSSGVYFANSEGYLVPENSPLPSPERQHPYVASKRRAEEMIWQGALPWTVLRPRAIYGPGDTSLLPRILDRLERGRLPVIGRGHTLSSMTHLENLTRCVELVLQRGPQGVLNVCDGEPVNLWEVIALVARQRGLVPPKLRLPYGLTYGLAGLLEAFHRAFPSLGEPSLTRYTVSLLGKSQSLGWDKARQQLGYQPLFDTFEGVERTLSGMSPPE